MSDGPSQSFSSTYTALVDFNATTGNLLVRGNLPLLQSGGPSYYFDYSDLNTAIQNLPLPSQIQSFDLSDYYLLVVCLLDNQSDETDLTLESANFNLTADQTLPPSTQWPTYPNWTPSTILGDGTINIGSGSTADGNFVWWPFEPQFNELSSGFQFDGLVTFVNSQLAQAAPSGKSGTVIYVHCDSGTNRTGTFAIAYLMLYGSSVIPGFPFTLTTAMTTGWPMATNDTLNPPDPDYYPMLLGFSLLASQNLQPIVSNPTNT